MMEYLFLIAKGFVTALAIAVPVGPVTILCLQIMLERGKKAGILAGLGAATAHALYTTVAALGLSTVCDILQRYQLPIQGAGVLLLIYFGVRVWLTVPAMHAEVGAKTLIESYATTLFFALANPLTVMFCSALLIGSGLLASVQHAAGLVALVGGVFLGTATWWTLVSIIVAKFRHKLSEKTLLLLNKITAVALFVFAILLISRFIGLWWYA